MISRRVASVLAGVVVVPAVAVTTAVWASAAPAVGFRIAQGAVLDHGIPQQADVVAIAWPNERVLDGLGKGDPVPMYVIGRARTDAAGRFAIAARPADLPASFRDARGRVDVELVIGHDQRETRFGYTANLTGADRWVSAAAEGQPADVRVDFGAATAYDASNDPARWVLPNGRPAGAAGRPTLARAQVAPITEDLQQLLSAPISLVRQQRLSPVATITSYRAQGLARAAIPCITYAGQMVYGRPESFLHALGWAGAKVTVFQNDGNEHTLGVGLRSGAGEWSSSGSKTISLAATAERGGVVDAWAWNKINYRDYLNSCAHTIQRRPHSVHSLLVEWTRAYHPIYKACARYTGGTYTKYRGTNTTYGAGTDIGPINVSAQSGWDRDTELKWTVTRATRLCGSERIGWVTSRDAEAHKG